MDHSYAVIMAGGGGTRLWPISRKKHPKHVLPLLGEKTLFQSTVDRLEGLLPPERILVVTTAVQEQDLKAQAAAIPEENYLIEPEPRGTASVVGLAASVLHRRDPDAVMLVLPADHFIRQTASFHQIIQVAVTVARRGYLVTLGIPPTFPATGYGYIQQAEPLKDHIGMPIFRALRFTEKPDEATARKMLASGDHYWNSGMFIWKVDRILDEISRQMPGLSAALNRINQAWGSVNQDTVLQSTWRGLESQTIDYGIMEHAAEVVVLPARGLEWNDVGAWDSLFEMLPVDKDGNVVVTADHLPIDTQGTLVYSTTRKLVATMGIKDLVIIDCEDALLVCRRDQAQQVRLVIDQLKKIDNSRYL